MIVERHRGKFVETIGSYINNIYQSPRGSLSWLEISRYRLVHSEQISRESSLVSRAIDSQIYLTHLEHSSPTPAAIAGS